MHQAAIKRRGLQRPAALRSQTVQSDENRLVIWLFVAVVFMVAILCVWSRAKVVSVGYEISRENRRFIEAKETNEKLRSELAMLKAPGRLEPIARSRFKLLPPKNHQIVLLK